MENLLIQSITKEEFFILREDVKQVRSEIKELKEQSLNQTTRPQLRLKAETAKDLRITLPSLDKLIQEGKLNRIKINGRVLIRQEDIDALIENSTSK